MLIFFASDENASVYNVFGDNVYNVFGEEVRDKEGVLVSLNPEVKRNICIFLRYVYMAKCIYGMGGQNIRT